jgi:hypothetical protein
MNRVLIALALLGAIAVPTWLAYQAVEWLRDPAGQLCCR